MKRALAAVAVSLLVIGCSSDSKPASTASSSSPAASGPVYASEGPFKVGYTTLHLADRDVAVWYPADDQAVAGKPKATYDQATPLPDDLKGLLPAEFNSVVTMNAFTDVPGSHRGPFPVVLFSHGAGGYRLINSALDVGIASWGFVVVSADYLERGLVAQVTGASRQSSNSPSPDDRQKAADRDTKIMFDSLDLVVHADAPGSVLEGVVDRSRVATVGHSAGGSTAFTALDDPRVTAAVGWAPVGPTGPPANKPTMIIGAAGDVALTPDALTSEYASFATPKRFVEVGGATVGAPTFAGHNTFTDLCDVIRSGKGIVEFARRNNLISGRLLDLAVNGCAATDLEPARFLPVVQHFTVAELRAVFGIDPVPVGLDDSITKAFGTVPVDYRHDP